MQPGIANRRAMICFMEPARTSRLPIHVILVLIAVFAAGRTIAHSSVYPTINIQNPLVKLQSPSSYQEKRCSDLAEHLSQVYLKGLGPNVVRSHFNGSLNLCFSEIEQYVCNIESCLNEKVLYRYTLDDHQQLQFQAIAECSTDTLYCNEIVSRGKLLVKKPISKDAFEALKAQYGLK
jgi:hypothetical protein